MSTLQPEINIILYVNYSPIEKKKKCCLQNKQKDKE